METEEERNDVPWVVVCLGMTIPLPTLSVNGPFESREAATDWWMRTKDFHDQDGSIHVITRLHEATVPAYGGQPLPINPELN